MKNKTCKSVLVPLVLVMLGNAPAKADEPAKNYSVSQDVMLTGAEEGRTLRLSGYGAVGNYNVYGVMDSFGPKTSTQNTYGELHLSKGVNRGLLYQTEVNSGLKGPVVFRTGPKIKLPTPKNTYADVKVLPLNVSTENGLLNETQIGFYGSANLGKWYAEDWIDHTVRYGEAPFTLGELTIGRQIGDNFSLQTQAAKDVNSSGWALRLGGRYKIF